jgi:hypothetical protein
MDRIAAECLRQRDGVAIVGSFDYGGVRPARLYWSTQSEELICATARTAKIVCRVCNIQAQLLWGLLFGSIGLGFFIYGKKQRAVVPMVCGLALMLFPYFVSNVMLLVGIGVLLIALPYFLRL